MRSKFPDDILAPGPTQLMIGTDNEPDLYDINFPMLQRGSGDPLTMGGVVVGHRVTGAEFTARFVRFTKRVREMAPAAMIVGPDHYHYDGWTTWHASMSQYSDEGRWFMDDFLASASRRERSGRRAAPRYVGFPTSG